MTRLNFTSTARIGGTLGTTMMLAALSSAQWLTHTTNVSGLSTTAVFSGQGGAYAGTVTTLATIINDGGNDGVPGITPYATNNLTATWQGFYPTNGSGNLEALNCAYNNSQDKFKVSFDFSGLTNKYMPTGTIMGLMDIDIEEDLERMMAYDSLGNLITTPWLNQFAGNKGFCDYDNTFGDNTGSVTAAIGSYGAGAYTWNGQTPNDTAAWLGFATTQDVSRIEFLLKKSNDQQPIGGTGGYAVAFGVVPEPSSFIGLGALMLGAVAKMRRRK